jgi:hypothetical protein
MTSDFMNAARALRTSQNKPTDFCEKIARHKDFAAVAAYDPDGARFVLNAGLENITDKAALWGCVMALIDTDAAEAIANSTRPEYLVHVLKESLAKMSAQDKADILETLPYTHAGAALKKNYPASTLMLKLG